jgi:UDP-N-acetylglucosamine:LPS N-acetylglucosamine transferase
VSYRHDPPDDQACPSPDATPLHPSAPRIVIFSASVGAGHDGAAAEIAQRLGASGFHVDRHDFVDLLPAHTGKLLRGAYHCLLTLAPSGYQRIYSTTERARRTGPVLRVLLRSAERRTLRALPSDTRAIVSTYHGASQVLGALRLRGELTVPALTYLTDFSVHPLWVAPGIDVHLAAHAVPAGQAQAQGATAVTVTGPVVNPLFTPATPVERDAARSRFGLPEHAPLALLVAGSWGVGPVREAAIEVLNSGVAVPVVVCGRNQALADRMRQDGIEHAYGWVKDMPGLMRACDVLVQNAGGLTSLEAFASGLPVASYRCIPGHGQANATALEEAGLATWIRGPDQLKPVLAELLDGPLGQRQRTEGLALFRAGPGPVQAVASTAAGGEIATAPARTVRRPVRRRITVLAATVTATVFLGISAPHVENYASARLESFTQLIEGHHR